MCARCPVSEGAGGGCSGDVHPRGAWSSRVLRGDRGFSAHDEGPAQNPGAGLSFCLCEAAPRFPPASCLGTARSLLVCCPAAPLGTAAFPGTILSAPEQGRSGEMLC